MSEQLETETVVDAPAVETAGAQDEGKTFTQAELDAIIGKRLAAHDRKYADYDQLKEAATKLSEIEKANLSEVEKAQAEASEWKTKYEQAVNDAKHAQLAAAVAAANETVLTADKLLRLLDVDSPDDVADAVAAFLTENPQLRKGPQVPQVPASPGASKKGGSVEIDPATASDEEWAEYVKTVLNA